MHVCVCVQVGGIRKVRRQKAGWHQTHSLSMIGWSSKLEKRSRFTSGATLWEQGNTPAHTRAQTSACVVSGSNLFPLSESPQTWWDGCVTEVRHAHAHTHIHRYNENKSIWKQRIPKIRLGHKNKMYQNKSFIVLFLLMLYESLMCTSMTRMKTDFCFQTKFSVYNQDWRLNLNSWDAFQLQTSWSCSAIAHIYCVSQQSAAQHQPAGESADWWF